MLRITERNDEKLRTLRHGGNVFQDALVYVREGENRFHVTDEAGNVPDYDLEYTLNMELYPENARAIILKATSGSPTYAPFLSYDEEDEDNMCLDFLRQFQKIELDTVDEYSVVFTRVVLKHTDIPVYYTDDRLNWFIRESDQLIKTDAFSSKKEKTTLRVTNSPFDMGYTVRDFTKLSSISAFQNVFFWQHFIYGKKGPFKYTEVILPKVAGIGGILAVLSSVGNACAVRGLTTFLRPGCTRYPEEFLVKYFKVSPNQRMPLRIRTTLIR